MDLSEWLIALQLSIHLPTCMYLSSYLYLWVHRSVWLSDIHQFIRLLVSICLPIHFYGSVGLAGCVTRIHLSIFVYLFVCLSVSMDRLDWLVELHPSIYPPTCIYLSSYLFLWICRTGWLFYIYLFVHLLVSICLPICTHGSVRVADRITFFHCFSTCIYLSTYLYLCICWSGWLRYIYL